MCVSLLNVNLNLFLLTDFFTFPSSSPLPLASCSALVCEPERDSDGHTVFVGLGNGQVIEFRLSKDLNRFEKKKIFYSKR